MKPRRKDREWIQEEAAEGCLPEKNGEHSAGDQESDAFFTI
jgi:hypothetical protein